MKNNKPFREISMPSSRPSRRRIAAPLFFAALLGTPTAAFAQSAAAPSNGADDATMVSLVKQLIEQNVITVQRGAEILAEHRAKAQQLSALTDEIKGTPAPVQPRQPDPIPQRVEQPRAPETQQVRSAVAVPAKPQGAAVAETYAQRGQTVESARPSPDAQAAIEAARVREAEATKAKAEAQAATEAAHAREAAAADAQRAAAATQQSQQAAIQKAIADAKKEMVAEAVTQAKAQILAQLNGELPPAAAPGTIRVQHVPDVVRDQIKAELRTEVMAQAKTEHWAAPDDASPDWVKRIKLVGDVRVRDQSAFYSKNNSNQIPDFARINQIGPIPILDRGYFIPLLDTTVDRPNRLEFRARLGVEVKVNDWFDAGMVIASGNDNSPISTNQILGGGLAKRDVWLDQAYLSVHPTDWASIDLGRFKNPFVSTELFYDEDLRFDGIAGKFELGRFVADNLMLSLRGGAFPLDYGDPNFPQNDVIKSEPPQRWLFSGQLAVGTKVSDSASIQIAASYHDYTNQQASLSDPCFLYRVQAEYRSGVICSTDNERAMFLRKGNTVAPIRNIVLDVPAPAVNETRVSPQFVGLVFNYRVLNLNAEARFKVTNGLTLTLTGDYVRNLAFNKNQLCRYGPALSEAFPPLNNIKPVEQGDTGDGNVCSQTNPSEFVGGNQGYLGTITFGREPQFVRGNWQAKVGYRYLQSDAVLDAFTDSDFHLGGTNAKGYTIAGKYSPLDHVQLGLRWMSANAITGEPFAIDVLQADLQVEF
jgi:hypothetical protein